MNITIHRGIDQIGGCITEIESKNGTKILIDFGHNLPEGDEASDCTVLTVELRRSSDAALPSAGPALLLLLMMITAAVAAAAIIRAAIIGMIIFSLPPFLSGSALLAPGCTDTGSG